MRLARWIALVMLLGGLGGLRLAAARPGGGQHYVAPSHSTPTHSSTPSHSTSPTYHSSPSSSSTPSSGSTTGSTSSGGGSSFGLILFLIILVVVIIIVIKQRGAGRERGSVAVDRAAQAQGIAALQREDPTFDPAAFGERTRATMAKVNEAWIKGAMAGARRLISDGVYVRFQTQLALLKAGGLRNVLVDWRATAAEVLAADADPLWDTVHVKVTAEGRDADVPAQLSPADAEKKARSAPVQPYQEVWSFVRRRGKKSKAGVPALAGQCPNCGADLPLSEVVRCEACKAVVNSGEHDWVLAEITQPEEWGATATGDVAGLAELRQRDPTVSRQELEDRASVVFWKWIEATVTGKRQKLDRFCLVKGQPPIEQVPLTMVAVGSSEVREVGPAQDGYDRAVVELNWSAAQAGGEPASSTLRVVLARSSQATSKRGLSSLDCPNCGGGLADSDAVKCTYCGEELSGGKAEWALDTLG